jgi:DNA primase
MIPPHLCFRTLKRRVSIEMVLRARGIELRAQRTRLTGPCPVHGGDNPTAFVVDIERQLWFCHTHCRRGGDVVDLVRLMDDCGYREVAEKLARLAEFAPIVEPAAPSLQASTFEPFVHRLFLDHDTPFLRNKGITTATAAAFETGAWHRRGFLEGCVGVRLHDARGNPVGYAGRRLEPAEIACRGKWKFPPLPKAELLYNYHRVAEAASQGLAVVEDPWSVMRLSQLGVPAVALFGVSLHPQQQRLLERARTLVLLMDGDGAGRQAAQRLRKSLRSHARHVVVRELPDGKDPDDLADDCLRSLTSSLSRRPSPHALEKPD